MSNGSGLPPHILQAIKNWMVRKPGNEASKVGRGQGAYAKIKVSYIKLRAVRLVLPTLEYLIVSLTRPF